MAKDENELIFSRDARRQLLQFRAFDQRRIVHAIRQQLVEADPRTETRNKFALDPPAESVDYELRVGNFRVFYRVEETEGQVTVLVAVIGRKLRNKVIVEGEEFSL
jgi:mRNA-degrading endonuclease RelE of RelBE toxin-antitoxin system